MRTKEELRSELIDLSKPLIEWLNNNYHPHVKLIIDTNGFELLEGEIAFVQMPEELEDFSNI